MPEVCRKAEPALQAQAQQQRPLHLPPPLALVREQDLGRADDDQARDGLPSSAGQADVDELHGRHVGCAVAHGRGEQLAGCHRVCLVPLYGLGVRLRRSRLGHAEEVLGRQPAYERAVVGVNRARGVLHADLGPVPATRVRGGPPTLPAGCLRPFGGSQINIALPSVVHEPLETAIAALAAVDEATTKQQHPEGALVVVHPWLQRHQRGPVATASLTPDRLLQLYPSGSRIVASPDVLADVCGTAHATG
mmetsp:Transcript_30951/g.92051  ORF Transcript_30951/g.92051 Transcript_30951/m.92051 type:complete len:249 (-) Transcript_30951:1516-2262(-)